MANWRPVDVRLWDDRKFLACGDRARLLWLFLLTCPSLPIPGVIVGGDAALAELLGWASEGLREGFTELSRSGLQVRREARIVWLPNALKYQPPTSPNTVKGWAKKWDDVPEGDLKLEMWEALRIACKSWSIIFAKVFPKPSSEGYPKPLLEGYPKGFGRGSTHDHQHDHQHQHDHDPEREHPPATHADEPHPVATDLELRQAAREVVWREYGELRQAIAAELGIDARPLPAHDPGERALAMRLVDAGPNGLQAAIADARHAMAVVAAEARATRSVQWLTGALFEDRSWRRAIGMTLDDARRAKGKAAVHVGRVEPLAPGDYTPGDQDL